MKLEMLGHRGEEIELENLDWEILLGGSARLCLSKLQRFQDIIQ